MSRRQRLLALVPTLLLVLALAPGASAATLAGITPVLDCVTYSPTANAVTAHFGYVNTNSSAVFVAVGSSNFFSPAPASRGQVTNLEPGVFHDVFSVTYPLTDGPTLTWTLGANSAIASNDPSLYCDGAGGPSSADSTLSMTPSLATTVGTDAVLTATVTDPAAPSTGEYGAVVFALPDGVETTPLPSGCGSVSAGLVSCAVTAGSANQLSVRSATPGSYWLTGTFVPSREGDATAGNNSATTTLRVTGAPATTTGPATSITATGAQLSGTVDPAGASTSATFTYWPDGHADQAVTTTGDDVGDGFAPVPVSTPLTGLAPSTTYDYAVSATNENGTATGDQGSFSTPAPASGLSLTASASPAAVTVGSPVTETFTVANGGPAAATGAHLAVQLSDPASAVTATPASGSCTVSGTPAAVSCDLGTIPAGTSVAVTVGATAASAGTLLGMGFVAGAEPDPSAADNAATTAVTVSPTGPSSADVSVTVAAPSSARVGTPFVAAVTVRNAGPDTATVVRMMLPPPGFAYVTSVTAPQGTCTKSGCALGSIPAGGEVQVSVTLMPRYAGAATLIATVRNQTPDPLTSNNRATARISISRR